MQITALRDDVLRVRVGPQGHLPEDASWAVLPGLARQSTPVSAEEDAGIRRLSHCRVASPG